MMNGIIIWTSIRNLKDILFVTLIFICIVNMEKVIIKKRYIYLIPLSIFYFLSFKNLRPSGEITYILIVLLIFFKENFIYKKMDFKKIMYLLLGMGLLVIVFVKIVNIDLILAFRDLIYKSPVGESENFSIIKILMEFFRFILGPGPIRSFHQLLKGNIFEVSTITADILIFIGSLQWWIMLAIFFFSILTKLDLTLYWIRNTFVYIMINLFIISTYTFIYGGTGDTRLRAMMYILTYITIYPILITKKIRKDDFFDKTKYKNINSNTTSAIY